MRILITLFTLSVQIAMFIGIIYGMHSTWIYIRDMNTSQKTKYLYDTQVGKYRNILDDLQKQFDRGECAESQTHSDDNTELSTGFPLNQMETDLEQFLKSEIMSNI
jgi:hypothetical protein